ncbi:PAS domain-containing protein [Methylobacterium sp. 77]|uniref:PAS domain-containing protein n=1 Tax=Methylobacterium sp. 77 TaxID=1101192 RepID=UPI00036DB707|nr:PAS domain-containing protein [Methylobacterium sp. 77]
MDHDDSSAGIEADRRTALARYGILDTETEADFDDIVKAASAACNVPISLISLLDGNRQWFKAETGFGQRETPISSSICMHAVREQDPVFVIPDTTRDERTSSNPLVTGDSHVRFYAGVPLLTAEGVPLGTLCVLDTKPNSLTPAQSLILRTLAKQVMTLLDLRRALQDRRESDRLNKAILESAVDYGIISMDLSGQVTSWNTGAERVLGWTEEEMRGEYAHVFFTEEDVENGLPEQEMGTALMHGRASDERWHRRKDGSLFWGLGEMMPLINEDDRPEGFIKILRDRTEQRLASQKQHNDAEFMRSVLASSADCIKVLDLDTRVTFMSEGGMRVMEVSDFNAIKGCPWPDFWCDQGNVDALAAIAAAKAGGTGHFRGQANTMAGNARWWDVQVTPILDTEGRPERLLSVSRDITIQKSAEQLISASEMRWRGLFTSMQEGFFLGELVRDAAGRAFDYRFLEINPAFARQSGLPEESVGRTIRDFVPDIEQELIDRYASVVETGEPNLFEITVPGLGRTFEVRAGHESDERFSCLFLDVTERKQSETRRLAIAELGDRLRHLSDPVAISFAAAEIMGRTLGLSHAGYGAVDQERETILVGRGWSAPGLARIDGLHQFREYGSYIDELKTGMAVLIEDAASDLRTSQDADSLTSISIRALLNLPVMERERFVALFYAAKDASHAWTAEEVSFVRNVADRTRAAIARIEAEAQQRVLNLELSHRMKNMLAMVQSIATQTMRNATDVATAKDVLAGRLIALGKSHDLLLGGSLGDTPLKTLIESALEAHKDKPDRFSIRGPALNVGAKAAMSLALILHELATNAAKYGALSTDTGGVAIVWDIRESRSEGTDQVLLRWVEAGGPPVEPPTRTGFGTRLIGRGLAGNFGGEVSLDYRTSGVVCTIEASLMGLQAVDTPPDFH